MLAIGCGGVEGGRPRPVYRLNSGTTRRQLAAARKNQWPHAQYVHGHLQLREHGESDAFDRALENAHENIMRAAPDDVLLRLNADGKELNREVFNMAKRFRENSKAYFKFITMPGMEPINNLAEQSVRFVVIDRHITQGTHGVKGS